MRIRLLAVCAILPAVAEGADPLPFKILDYRITGPSEILLHTNGSVVSIRGAAMDIALKGAADPVMTAPMAADGSRDVILRLPQNLTKSQSYELRLRSDAASSVYDFDAPNCSSRFIRAASSAPPLTGGARDQSV